METELKQLGSSMSSSYPAAGSVLGWIPFVVAILFSFVFAAVYIHYFWKKHESDRLSAVTATVGLWVALLTSLLLPVDVFLISYMKDSNGTFKDWATNETRIAIEDSLSYTYYTFYGLIMAFAFFFLPLVYFAYEEKDDEYDSMLQRLCISLRYTSVFCLFAVVLIIIGAFVPYENRVIPNNTANMTEWDKFEKTISDMYSNRGEEAIIFVVNVLTMIGMLAFVVYTGFGLSSFPIDMLRGWRNLRKEKDDIGSRREIIQSKISAIRTKAEQHSLSSKDLRTLNDLEEQERLLLRMENEVEAASGTIWQKLQPVMRIFDVSLGIFCMLLGLILWISLLIVNIDKALHSFGFKSGYLIADVSIFNPLNYIMVASERVFPIDYVLYCGIVVFLISCTIAGIRYIGIWCLCVKMFKIRPHRTEPQGLIILCVILMYVVLALNVLMYETIPQYTTFGSQHYRESNDTYIGDVVPCSHLAPKGECLMTRASIFILNYAMKASVFVMLYYWMSWAFLAMVLIGFFTVLIRQKRSRAEEAVDPDDFDESDTDERPLVP